MLAGRSGRTWKSKWRLLLCGAAAFNCSLVVEPDPLDDGCPSGTKICGEPAVCVRNDLPEYGCASPGFCGSCSLPGAQARCDGLGRCAIGGCLPGFRDCDDADDNGCEIHALIDPLHCGACNEVCPPVPHVPVGDHERFEVEDGRSCLNGTSCVVRACEPGWGDCDGRYTNGCETNLMTTPEHCGRCDRSCSQAQVCREETCEDAPDRD